MALTATDWTVVIGTESIQSKVRYVTATLTLAAAGTYPTGGIPMPVFGTLGMRRNIDSVDLIDDVATDGGRVLKYSQTSHTLRVFSATATTNNPIDEMATTVTPGAIVLYVRAAGW